MRTAGDGDSRADCPTREGLDAASLVELLRTAQGGTVESAVSDTGSALADGCPAAATADGVSRGVAPHVAQDALERLLARLYEPVRRFAFGRVRGYPDASDVASDIAQEALMRLAEAVRRCRADTDGQIIAWALVTARRVLIGMLRRPGSGLAAREVATLLDADIGALVDDLAPTQRADASPAFAILLRLTMDAYAETAPHTAELLWTRLIEGAEWEEIGRDFGTTGPGAKRRFQRATARLRQLVRRRITSLDTTERRLVERLLARILPGARSQRHTGRGAA